MNEIVQNAAIEAKAAVLPYGGLTEANFNRLKSLTLEIRRIANELEADIDTRHSGVLIDVLIRDIDRALDESLKWDRHGDGIPF